MNTENFNQIEVLSSKVKDKMQYMKFTESINFYNNEILGISIPDKVTLEVVETSDAVKGDTKNNAMKDAILQTGLKIKFHVYKPRRKLLFHKWCIIRIKRKISFIAFLCDVYVWKTTKSTS